MTELDEAWKAKSLNESQSIQSIKVKTVIINEEGERKNLHDSNISNQQGNERNYHSIGDNSSFFGSKNENKLITSITLNTEQKKKYEEHSKKYIDLKQKLVTLKLLI